MTKLEKEPVLPKPAAVVQGERFIRGELLNETEAALYLSVAPRTLAHWRRTGGQPLSFVRIGRSIRYSRDDLIQFIEACTEAGVPPTVGALFKRPKA